MSVRQRLYPEWESAALMVEHCQQARFVYNIGLEQRSLWTEQRRYYAQKVNLASQMRELAELRGDLDWLRAGSSVVQQAALRDLDRAYANFFAGRSGYPNFKKRSRTRGAFVVRDLTVRRVNRKWGTVLVPKVGHVRFRLTRDWALIANATSARVTFAHDQWHISFTTPPPARIAAGTGAMIGIDRGVANSLATSDGEFFHAPSLTSGEQQRFLALERRYARQVKHSNRRRETLRQLDRLRGRLTHRRTDWVEKTTTSLARAYDLIALEALPVRNMTRRAAPRPDPLNPGRFLPNGAAAKTGLNRAILANLWGRIDTRLEQKTDHVVVHVNPRNTSRECNICHHISIDNRKSQAVFACEQCGAVAHADVNAAGNVLDRGIVEQGRTRGLPGVWAYQSRESRANHLPAAQAA